MHLNPAFRKNKIEKNIAFAAERSFGALLVNAENGPLISHIPFRISEDGSFLEAHLVRSNPILRLLDDKVDCVIAVTGGDAYISPDWYDVPDQVPTWNYVSVHLRGTLRKLPQEELHGILERLSAQMELQLPNKKPWTIDKMDQEIYEKMQRQIVPIAMEISDIKGTWKLSQNKPQSAINGTINGLESSDVGSEIGWLIGQMKQENDL